MRRANSSSALSLRVELGYSTRRHRRSPGPDDAGLSERSRDTVESLRGEATDPPDHRGSDFGSASRSRARPVASLTRAIGSQAEELASLEELEEFMAANPEAKKILESTFCPFLMALRM